MSTPSVEALARRLRSLDGAELAALVAALWTARGFEASVEGGLVIAERAGRGDRDRLACGDSSDSAAVDAVVVPGDGGRAHEAPVISAEDLARMLLYAIDRPTAERLACRHLDGPLDAAPPLTVRERLPSVTARPLLILTLAVAFIAVALGLGLLLGPTADAPADAGSTVPVPPDATESPVPSQATRVPLAFAGPIRQTPRESGYRYPAGLEAAGVTDAGLVAAGHRAELVAEDWTMQLVLEDAHDVLHPFRRWESVEQTVIRIGPTRYRYDVVGEAWLNEGSLVSVTYVDYGDGTANYRRSFGQPSKRFSRTQLPATNGSGVFARASAAYVERYLSTTQSRVHEVIINGEPHAIVVATGRPTELSRTVEDYRAIAVLDRRGVVQRLVVEYTLLRRVPDPTPNGVATPYRTVGGVATERVGRVQFEMVLDADGEVTLGQPSWYVTARNATEGDGLPPWPNDPAV